jgi:very-short-patch-repair endonuclease
VAAEREVARIAARQHGVVTTDQLAAAGLSGTQLTRRVAGGWLVRRHVGIYRLGVFGGHFEEEMAALLACGPRSALGRWSSITVFGLGPRPSQVHVVFDGNRGGRRAGVRAYRTSLLPASDVVVKHGLRVTTPARTLLDLAAEAPRDTLERLIEEVQVQGLATTAELLAMAARGAGRRGVSIFRELVDFLDEPLFTRSEAERRLGILCRTAGLPLPRMNTRRAGWEVDAVWDAQRLVVEVDGHKFHAPAPQFERDRRKDGELMLAGYRVLRITWRRLTREPEQVIALIAGALALADGERAQLG